MVFSPNRKESSFRKNGFGKIWEFIGNHLDTGKTFEKVQQGKEIVAFQSSYDFDKPVTFYIEDIEVPENIVSLLEEAHKKIGDPTVVFISIRENGEIVKVYPEGTYFNKSWIVGNERYLSQIKTVEDLYKLVREAKVYSPYTTLRNIPEEILSLAKKHFGGYYLYKSDEVWVFGEHAANKTSTLPEFYHKLFPIMRGEYIKGARFRNPDLPTELIIIQYPENIVVIKRYIEINKETYRIYIKEGNTFRPTLAHDSEYILIKMLVKRSKIIDNLPIEEISKRLQFTPNIKIEILWDTWEVTIKQSKE